MRRIEIVIETDESPDTLGSADVARILHELAELAYEGNLGALPGLVDRDGNNCGTATITDVVPGDAGDAAFREKAHEQYADGGKIEFDGDAEVSIGNDGAYVHALVCVSWADIGIDPNADPAASEEEAACSG